MVALIILVGTHSYVLLEFFFYPYFFLITNMMKILVGRKILLSHSILALGAGSGACRSRKKKKVAVSVYFACYRFVHIFTPWNKVTVRHQIKKNIKNNKFCINSLIQDIFALNQFKSLLTLKSHLKIIK